MDNITRLIIEQLDIKTIRNIQKYCTNYLTYSVDFKQVINRYGVKLQAKEIAELQEYCNFMLVMKQAEIKEENTQEKTTETKELNKGANASNCENITSTMAEGTATSKKKEKKA